MCIETNRPGDRTPEGCNNVVGFRRSYDTLHPSGVRLSEPTRSINIAHLRCATHKAGQLVEQRRGKAKNRAKDQIKTRPKKVVTNWLRNQSWVSMNMPQRWTGQPHGVNHEEKKY